MTLSTPAPISRRELLFLILAGTFLLFGLTVAVGSLWFLLPGAAAGSAVTQIGRETEFPPAPDPYRWQDKETGLVIWIVSRPDGLTLFDGRTPNDYWQATHGHRCLFTWNRTAAEFQDPCSGDHFDLDGVLVWVSPQAGERAARRYLDRYKVQIAADGVIRVDLNRPLPGIPVP